MVTCSFCNKELERNVFCSSSCKLKFFRKSKKDIPKTPKEVKDVVKEKFAGLCKHGAMKGLCRFGC